MRFYGLIPIIALLVFSGCERPSANTADKQTKPKTETQKPLAETPLAEVNGKPVTSAMFDAYLKFKRAKPEDGKRRQSLLDQFVEREALASAIESENLLDNDLLRAELDEFRREMLIGRYFEKYLNETVSETAVKNYYTTHTAEYEQKKAHAAHILIRTHNKMSEPERKARLTKAREARSFIQTGREFSEIATQYSEDSVSAQKGGDLGWIKEGAIDRRFSEVLFGMQPGDVSEPFETGFGFHVVKLLEGPNIVKTPFDAVAGDIRHKLRNMAKQAEIKRLREKTNNNGK